MEAERQRLLTLGRVDGRALRAASDARVIAWLARALAALESASLTPEAIGSPLSAPVLHDALETTARVSSELADAALAIAGRLPRGRVAMILAANVETAVVRPLVWALLARNEVVVRASSRRPGLAPHLVEALRRSDLELAQALGIVRFERTDEAAGGALARWADALHVYGDDETVRELAASSACAVHGHGHGLGLALLTAASMERLGTIEHASELFLDLARDIGRYDQRGCLSPHAVLIEAGAPWSDEAVGRTLHAALGALDGSFPRGTLDQTERLAERRWRDVALALGTRTYEGSGHAVTVEQGALRSCPTGRNIAVHALAAAEIDALVAQLGPSLKCVGLPDAEALREHTARVATPADRVRIGTMQTPRHLSPADGVAPWTGFVA